MSGASATEAYKAQQISKNEFLLRMGMKREKWNEDIERSVKRFNDTLPKALYAAALITATQTSPFLSRRHREKSFIRGLSNWFFVESREQEALLVDGRGRKAKIDSSDVYAAILRRGQDASRKGVAFDLGVSEKTINDWRIAHRYPSWKAAVEFVMKEEKFSSINSF